MPLFIIERKNTARKNSLAVHTYLMTGFDNSADCALAWKKIVGEDHPSMYKIHTLEEYIDSRIVHEIVNEPTVIRADKGDNDSIHLSTLSELSTYLLIKKSILVVNVSAPMESEYHYSGNKMIAMKKSIDKFVSDFLFNRENIGKYIHVIGSVGPKLSEVINKQYSISKGNAGVVVMYNDITMTNIQIVENELFGIRHESVLITEHSMFQIIINDDEFVLKYISANN